MKYRIASTRNGMSVVGSSGWYAALGVLSTPPARSRARDRAFRRSTRRDHAHIRGKCGGLSGHQEVTEGAPVEALAASLDQLDETRRRRLGVGERVVRLPVHHAQPATEPLEPDGVLEIEELRREPRGVNVVRIEARSDGAPDESRVESIGAVL